ncbi:MAG: cysteine desulfurase [Clostridia bacterium]|nr:cysteine desulfurase [Clostridia bacterium]
MTEKQHIYLDNSATTRICKEALDKYVEASLEVYANPSSLHSEGVRAEKLIDEARRAVLSSLGERDSTVIFTASGSEANNLAIIGRANAKARFQKKKIITALGEHASVTEPLAALKAAGFNVVAIPTTSGKLDTGALLTELTPDVILVSLMMVNNETGALYDTAWVKKMMVERCPEALLHVDATQSYMKVKFTKKSSGADMITLSSHKIEGPKGVGALVVDNKIIKSRGLIPQILGGGQEYGFRSGTENVPAIAAFGVAVNRGVKLLDGNISKMRQLREYLIDKLTRELPEITITNPERSAPHILNITLPNIKSETALHYLSSLGIFVSSGSACSSNSAHTSGALLAYGRSAVEADSSIRISFCPENTEREVDALCDGLASALLRLVRFGR